MALGPGVLDVLTPAETAQVDAIEKCIDRGLRDKQLALKVSDVSLSGAAQSEIRKRYTTAGWKSVQFEYYANPSRTTVTLSMSPADTSIK